MQTTLELYLCSNLEEDTVLYHRSCLDISQGLEDPDSLLPPMFFALGITTEEDGICAHSTSWRYDNGRILLTYLAWQPQVIVMWRNPKLSPKELAVMPVRKANQTLKCSTNFCS